jgi:hypothetical protein
MANFSKHEVATNPVKQLLTERLLKRTELPTDRWLGQA